ncbi:MAG: 50S ribosomal protein L17 [Patescibacteria group bacterium]
MRHRKKGKKLGRKKDQRRLLCKNLAADLILKEKIKTTEAKAKFARPYLEKLITIAKKKNLFVKQRLHSLLSNKKAEKKLLTVIAPKYKERKGGYTRILKLKERKGDGAQIALLELV